MLKHNAGTYFGQVSKTINLSETKDMACACCEHTIAISQEYYIHEQLELDFCSPNCLTKEINKLMSKAA